MINNAEWHRGVGEGGKRRRMRQFVGNGMDKRMERGGFATLVLDPRQCLLDHMQ